MKNTENDYLTSSMYNRTTLEKTDQQRNMRQPDIADPAEAEGMPAKILPIIDKGYLKPKKDNDNKVA